MIQGIWKGQTSLESPENQEFTKSIQREKMVKKVLPLFEIGDKQYERVPSALKSAHLRKEGEKAGDNAK
jgi:hypothetical protein